MNLFEAVKAAIPTRMAAEHYGIEVKRVLSRIMRKKIAASGGDEVSQQ